MGLMFIQTGAMKPPEETASKVLPETGGTEDISRGEEGSLMTAGAASQGAGTVPFDGEALRLANDLWIDTGKAAPIRHGSVKIP